MTYVASKHDSNSFEAIKVYRFIEEVKVATVELLQLDHNAAYQLMNNFTCPHLNYNPDYHSLKIWMFSVWV